ncbi:MAG: bifunctional DNA-formamidopyrimidine glycosylase/DNA-(apurinic or apyrimidinic site) lyase [Alphaproteobacteria bacterium]|nr:bifunctional DNA-formamidopyrimidine glycosylase/DNA-(apurinic or apyrimidinic site) lyase [Alphaproteobacteria bacterium]
MPELPEVETVCRGLAGVLEGRQLVRVETRRRDLRIPFPPRFAARVEGHRVLRVRRRAKYVLIELDDGNVVIAHLGMSGRMTIERRGGLPGKHDHVVMATDAGTEIRLNDPRRFGLMTIAHADELDEHKLFKNLGPDPLSAAFTPESLSASLKGRATSIKAALLDQRNVAGLGNIYVSESLYRAGISPKRKAGTVAGDRAVRLVPEIKAVLRDAIAAGGSTLRDHVQPNGELGYFQHQWRVYDRAGEPCPKHPGASKPALIKRIVQGGRSTFYCPACQR